MEGWLDSADGLVAGWWWIVALVVLFAVVYKTGLGGSGRTTAGAGCLAAVVITLLVFLFVIF